MDPLLDIESRSPVNDTAATLVVVPADVHQTIKKIVSLLSRALVLSLSLLTAMVVADGPPNMELEETSAVMQIEGQLQEDPVLTSGDSSAVVEQVRSSVVNGNRYADL